MLTGQKLYMLLLGCKPKDRLTEQHDIFFGIAPSLKLLVPKLKKFWPQGRDNLHIDAWREVQFVDGYKISICREPSPDPENLNLFFINLGGYQKGNFDEPHYKLLIVAPTEEEAATKAMTTEFYRTMGFNDAISHIDNKYDVDDIINIKHALIPGDFYLDIKKSNEDEKSEDEIHLGYFKLSELKD